MGTARYAAPEQARGDRIDGRADCYSLAVVLIESLTGQVPNVGETAVSTVVARGSRPLDVPPGLGRLGQVLEIAGRPDPDRRFPDAGVMAEALTIAARDLPPPEPLVLPGLRATAVDPDPTRIARSAGALADADGSDDGFIDDPVAASRRGRRARPPGSRRLVPTVVGVVIAAALVVVGLTAASVGTGFGALAGGDVGVPEAGAVEVGVKAGGAGDVAEGAAPLHRGDGAAAAVGGVLAGQELGPGVVHVGRAHGAAHVVGVEHAALAGDEPEGDAADHGGAARFVEERVGARLHEHLVARLGEAPDGDLVRLGAARHVEAGLLPEELGDARLEP
jgi:hypothetical protein